MAKRCAQTAVYWANPVNDGFNHFTFDDPIEIKCRWQDKIQILGQPDETQMISRAIALVTQDMTVDGLLWLGTLSQLSSIQRTEPHQIPNICIIKRFEKSPFVGSSTEYLRKVHLTPWIG